MKNNKNLIIKNFKIEQLFGIYNVDIPFDKNVNIFVGENGLGKTTILNCINYVLRGDVENLSNIDFKTIEVILGNEEKVIITHEELLKSRNAYYKDSIRYIESDDSDIPAYVKSTVNRLLHSPLFRSLSKERQKERLYRQIRIHEGINITMDEIEKIYNDIIDSVDKKSWNYKIKEYINKNIIYLPTYRRIEEDFNKFIDNSVLRDSPRFRKDISSRFSYMQFGMEDVFQQINTVCTMLKDNTNTAFKEMTGNLLKNYVNIITEDSNKKIKKRKTKIDAEKLKIVFSRLADEIDEQTKIKIIDAVINPKNEDKQSDYFRAIIDNLIEIYEGNKNIDESLEKFKDVCNQYLVNNRIIYDNLNIKCYVEQLYSKEEISLKNLSSGEKQIISLFSKLYLSEQEDNIVLFDEPELSLSIVWQAKLIPDIVNSKKCSFAVIITHSPFIFDNEYRELAMDIKKFITPIEKK